MYSDAPSCSVPSTAAAAALTAEAGASTVGMSLRAASGGCQLVLPRRRLGTAIKAVKGP